MNGGPGKECGKLATREQLYGVHFGPRLLEVGNSPVPPHIEPVNELCPDLAREILEPRNKEVWLERKPPVRSLNKVAPAHAHHFISHPALILVAPNVLDHRVREDDIERLVRELRHGSRIARCTYERGRCHPLVLDVEKCDSHVAELTVRHQRPEILRSPHIEYLRMTRQGFQQRQEKGESRAPHAPRQRFARAVVGKRLEHRAASSGRCRAGRQGGASSSRCCAADLTAARSRCATLTTAPANQK